MDPSLVGSQMSSDASCEESSIHEGAGYDKAFGSGDESEDFLPSSERGTSARSPDDDESYTEGGKDEVEKGREDEGVGGDINVDVDDSDGDNSDGDKGPSEGFQRDLEITVLSFSLRIGPSTNFYLG